KKYKLTHESTKIKNLFRHTVRPCCSDHASCHPPAAQIFASRSASARVRACSGAAEKSHRGDGPATQGADRALFAGGNKCAPLSERKGHEHFPNSSILLSQHKHALCGCCHVGKRTTPPFGDSDFT